MSVRSISLCFKLARCQTLQQKDKKNHTYYLLSPLLVCLFFKFDSTNKQPFTHHSNGILVTLKVSVICRKDSYEDRPAHCPIVFETLVDINFGNNF